MRHGISLNLTSLVGQGLDSQGNSSPVISTGRFQIAPSTQQASNTASKRSSVLYNVDVLKENYQELDPLIPRQSSINQKNRQRQSDPSELPQPVTAINSNQRLFSSSEQLQARTHQQSTNFNQLKVPYYQGSRNALHELDSSVEKMEREIDKFKDEGSSENLGSSTKQNAFLVHEKTTFNLKGMERHLQKNNFTSTEQISSTIFAGLPDKDTSLSHPENKSLSPLTGKARYPQLIHVKTAGVGRGQHTKSHEAIEQIDFSKIIQNSRQDQLQEQSSPTFRKISMDFAEENKSFDQQTKAAFTFLAPNRTTTAGSNKNRQLSKRPVSRQKQHSYYVDISDIVKTLTGTVLLLEKANLEFFLSNQSQTSVAADTQQNQSILEVAGGDNEAATMLKFVEEQTGIAMSHFLQTNRVEHRAYQTEDSALITSVFFEHAKEQISKSLTLMNNEIASYINTKFQGRQGTARLGFSSEKELFNIFRNMFGAEIFGQVGNNNSVRNTDHSWIPRRIMGELWQAIQLFRCINQSQQGEIQNSTIYTTISAQAKILQKQIQKVFQTYPAETITAYLTAKLLLHCRGKAIFCSERKNFILHKAVFEGNLPMISRLISCRHEGTLFVEKNEIDFCGNSPLVIAIRLRNIDAVKILTDLYCSAKLNPFPQVHSALEIAKTMKDRKIVEILMSSVQKVKQHYLEVHKDAIFKVLERLPDFSIDLHFECTSNFIPGIKHITPSDTYHIFKQGSNLRLDMRFLGYKRLKATEGNITVLFKGRNSGESEGELLLVDHDSGRVASIFEDATNAKIERDLDNIMMDQDIQKKYRAEKLKIEPECDRKGKVITQLLDEFTVVKYSINTTYTMTKFKLNTKHVEMLTKYKTYEDYIKFMKINIFSLGNEAKRKQSLPQVSSRTKAFAATAKNNLLLVDIEQDSKNHLLTQDNFGMDKRQRRDSSMNNNCKVCRIAQMGDDQHAQTFRQKVCSCEEPNRDDPNFGLNLIITSQSRKTVSANMWLCKDHPLSIETFLPLLQVLSFSSKQIRKLEQAIGQYNLPKYGFPLKAKVPIYMIIEATFSFRNLQLGTLAEDVFELDKQVNERKRESLKQHYQNMQNKSNKSLIFHSEEDIRRQNQTLTKLYKQLSLADSHRQESQTSSSNSDNIELRYQRMLSEPDQNKENQEESKTQIIYKKEEESVENIILVKAAANSIGSVKSSNERLTPANEYDIGIDSASHHSRVNLSSFRSNLHQPVKIGVEQDPLIVKTARQIGQVKTMSQINQRHERHLLSSESEVQIKSQFLSFSRPAKEKETLEHRRKLQANQYLIERLTGKPLPTQERKSHTQDNVQLIADEILRETAQEKKKRRKELIRLHKLQKIGGLDKMTVGPLKYEGEPNQASTMVKQVDLMLASENIMDSRVVDQRPFVNETLEKRNLISYNNPSMVAQQVTFTTLKIPDRSQEDSDQANANVGSKRSATAIQPPFSIVKKDVGFNSSSNKITYDDKLTSSKILAAKKAGISTADESSGQSERNYNSISQRSFNSLTKSLQNSAVAKGAINSGGLSFGNKDSGVQNNNQNGISSKTQSFMASIFGNQAPLSTLKRRLDDHNHLQTIESEEIQGTEGTNVQAHDISRNPYQSNQSLKILSMALLKNAQRNNPTRQTQDLLLDSRATGKQKAAQSADQSQKPSLSSILSPQTQPFILTNEEKETLVNPHLVLNRLHQYVLNNKDSIQSLAQTQIKVQNRKKQRGHTSYVSSAKLQDERVLDLNSLTNVQASSSNTRAIGEQPVGSSPLQLMKEASNVGSKNSGKSPYSSLQVLLMLKPNASPNPASHQRGLTTTSVWKYTAQAMGGTNRKAVSDVDVVL